MLLAVYMTVKRFRHSLEGRHFTIFTDYKPLIFAYKQKPEKASPRQFHHLDYIGQFITDIRHISGADNVVADALSRTEVTSTPTKLDFAALANAQKSDAKLMSLLNSDTNLVFKLSPISKTDKKKCAM